MARLIPQRAWENEISPMLLFPKKVIKISRAQARRIPMEARNSSLFAGFSGRSFLPHKIVKIGAIEKAVLLEIAGSIYLSEMKKPSQLIAVKIFTANMVLKCFLKRERYFFNLQICRPLKNSVAMPKVRAVTIIGSSL